MVSRAPNLLLVDKTVLQLIPGQFNIDKRYIFEEVQGALFFASFIMLFLFKVLGCLIIHFVGTGFFFHNTFNDYRCFVG